MNPVTLTLVHVVLDSADHDQCRNSYQRLFGVAPERRAGFPWDVIQFASSENYAAPGLIFTVKEYDSTVRLLRNRGLSLTSRTRSGGGETSFVSTYGVTMGFIPETCHDESPHAEIKGIDHVVLRTSRRERIIATLAGQLGLDFRLQRNLGPEMQQLFFRCHNTVVEVIVSPELDTKEDSLWGIAWRVRDLDTLHTRLMEEGVTVSDIRDGVKPGTRVATVKDSHLATKTLLIEQSAQ